MTGGSDLDPATHGLQHNSRIGLKSFEREKNRTYCESFATKRHQRVFFCFFLQYVYLLSPVPLQREQHPPPPPPQPPTPPILLTHTPPPETKKKKQPLVTLWSLLLADSQAQRATVFSFALLGFVFSSLFHIKLDRVIKEGWVQSDTARLEQSQQLVCQGNDRREEEKKWLSSLSPHLISPALFCSLSLDLFNHLLIISFSPSSSFSSFLLPFPCCCSFFHPPPLHLLLSEALPPPPSRSFRLERAIFCPSTQTDLRWRLLRLQIFLETWRILFFFHLGVQICSSAALHLGVQLHVLLQLSQFIINVGIALAALHPRVLKL